MHISIYVQFISTFLKNSLILVKLRKPTAIGTYLIEALLNIYLIFMEPKRKRMLLIFLKSIHK